MYAPLGRFLARLDRGVAGGKASTYQTGENALLSWRNLWEVPRRGAETEESVLGDKRSPSVAGCKHTGSIDVSRTPCGKKRARCLVCETIGPKRRSARAALRALRDEARGSEKGV
jgi:hypothetical protein